MYAVIELQGHQYIIKKGDRIIVDNVDQEIGSKITCENVLLTFAEDQTNIKIGTPFVKGVKVTCEVVETKKGEKIKVVKFRRKNRYQRNIGFRPLQSYLEIKEIKVNG